MLEGISPILLVFHYDDGSWQFSGLEENLTDEDYRIISLHEMIKQDRSIVELADMPKNSQAMRLNPESPWRITIKN